MADQQEWCQLLKQVIFGNSVILLEKMDSLGKKLLITGKGRCNITSSLPIEDFIQNVPGMVYFCIVVLIILQIKI